MQASINFWNDLQRQEVGNELDKLFALQDRPFTKDKKFIFIEELEKFGFPLGAIIGGIRALMLEDMKIIKIVHVREAAKKFIEPEEKKKIKCRWCGGVGAFCMREEAMLQMADEWPKRAEGPRFGRSYALACVCEAGTNLERSDGNVRWNGKGTQFSNGRMLTAVFTPIEKMWSVLD